MMILCHNYTYQKKKTISRTTITPIIMMITTMITPAITPAPGLPCCSPPETKTEFHLSAICSVTTMQNIVGGLASMFNYRKIWWYAFQPPNLKSAKISTVCMYIWQCPPPPPIPPNLNPPILQCLTCHLGPNHQNFWLGLYGIILWLSCIHLLTGGMVVGAAAVVVGRSNTVGTELL